MGSRNAAIDTEAAKRHGIEILHTGYDSAPTIEFTWALILALTRNVVAEDLSLRSGGWQTTVGADLHGKTLGIVGLGNIGTRVAEIGRAFHMNVIAWSQTVLSRRTRGLVVRNELELMKPMA